MNDSYYIRVTTQELCDQLCISQQTVIEIIEHGIIEPEGGDPGEWQFDPSLVSLARRAARLHHDLDIDWNGVAMALQLLEEKEKLQIENLRLKNQLRRFLID